MKIDIDIEDYTIILNALHYYKKVEKRGNFQDYTEMRINFLRDKLAKQLADWTMSERKELLRACMQNEVDYWNLPQYGLIPDWFIRYWELHNMVLEHFGALRRTHGIFQKGVDREILRAYHLDINQRRHP